MQKKELLQLSICEFCNLECKFCSQYKLNSKENDFSKNTMSLNKLDEILESSINDKFNTISLVSGGEIFFYKNSISIIQKVFEFNFKNKISDNIVIYSNGTLFNNEKIEQFFSILNKYPQNLRFVFSINAFEKQTYFNITGHDLLEDCIKNTLFFIDKSIEYNKVHNNLFVGVQLLIVEENLNEILDFKNFWQNIFSKRNIEFEIISSDMNVNRNYSIIYRKAFLIDQKKCEILFEKSMDILGISYKANSDNIVDSKSEDYDFNIRKRLPCVALWKYPYISSQGDITICCKDVNFEYIYANISDKNNNNEKLEQYKKYHIKGDFRKMPLCYTCTGYENSEFSLMRDIISQEFPEFYNGFVHRLNNGVFYDFKFVDIEDKHSNYNKLIEFLKFSNKKADSIVCNENIDIDKKFIFNKITKINYEHSFQYVNFPCPYWFNVLKVKENGFFTGCDKVDIPYETVNLFDFDDISHIPLKCIICNERPEIDSNVIFSKLNCYLSEYSVENGEKYRNELINLLSNEDIKKTIEFLNQKNNKKLTNIFWDNVKIDYLKDINILKSLCEGNIGRDFYNLFCIVKYFPDNKKDRFYEKLLYKLFEIYPHPTILEYICDYLNLNNKTEYLFEFLENIDLQEYINTNMFKGNKILITMLRILVSKGSIKKTYDFLQKYSEFIEIPHDIFEKLYSLFMKKQISVYDFFLILNSYFNAELYLIIEYLSKDFKYISNENKIYIVDNCSSLIINCLYFSEFIPFICEKKEITKKYLDKLCLEHNSEKLVVFVFESKINFDIKESETILNSIIYSQKYNLLKNLDFNKLVIPDFFTFDFLYNAFKLDKLNFDDFLFFINLLWNKDVNKFLEYISVDFKEISLESRISFLIFLTPSCKNRDNILKTIFFNLETSGDFNKFAECYLIDDNIKLNDSDILILKNLFYSKRINKSDILFIVEKYIKTNNSKHIFKDWEYILIDENYFVMWNKLMNIFSIEPNEKAFEKLYFAFCQNNLDNYEILKILKKIYKERQNNLINSLRKDVDKFNDFTRKIIIEEYGENLIPELLPDKKIMEKLDLYLAKNDFDNIINLLLSDKRINPSKEIIKKVWDYFEKNENYQVLKDIIERFDDFSPDLNKFKNNINLISDIFLKLFFISKLFPKQKKICLESIIQNIQNIKMPYRIKFIKDYKKDVEQAGFLEYFSQILWQNKLYYSFFKLDYYLENRFSDNLNDLRIFRLALITAIKKNDKGLLRKLSGIYQQKGDYLKALKLYELVFDSIDKNFDNINSMIFLYEKNNMLWKAFKINLKVVFKNPVFFIKKNIIIVVKLFK